MPLVKFCFVSTEKEKAGRGWTFERRTGMGLVADGAEGN
jgi:hypothetical protein